MCGGGNLDGANYIQPYPVTEHSTDVDFVGTFLLDLLLQFLLVGEGLVPDINVILQCE